MNIRSMPLSREEISEKLAYDPESGVFTWRIDISRNIKAGSEAGCIKVVKLKRSGIEKPYKYITIDGVGAPAARLAWYLHYGEWPATNIQFKDGNTINLQIDNLRLAKFPAVKKIREGRRVYKMSKDAARHYGLRRYYGLSIQEYSERLLAQGGVCAICGNKETAQFDGKVKPLSVDHDHVTGKIRDLLCSHCNHMVGHSRENPDYLLKAADYIKRHSSAITCDEVAA